MTTTTYDSASQRVCVAPTNRQYRGRPLAIVYDLDERGERTDTGYIVALTPHCAAIDDEDREIVFRAPVLGDLSRGEWLADWGGVSDKYDDPDKWVIHNADLGDTLELCERFAELLRRHAGELDPPIDVAALCGAVKIHRVATIGDAIRWLAGSLPMLDAYAWHDGRVVLFDCDTTGKAAP